MPALRNTDYLNAAGKSPGVVVSNLSAVVTWLISYRLSKTEVIPRWVSDRKVALAPRCICRFGRRGEPCISGLAMQFVDVIHVKDCPPPVGAGCLLRFNSDEIHMRTVRCSGKGRKVGVASSECE